MNALQELIQLEARLDTVLFEKKKDPYSTGRVATRYGVSGALGAVGGRLAAYHPVTGGHLKTGTAIGAAVGLGSQALSEKWSREQNPRITPQARAAGIKPADVQEARRSNPFLKVGVAGAAYSAALRTEVRGRERSMEEAMSGIGGFSEEEAAKRIAEETRKTGTKDRFIPRFGKNVNVPGRPKTVDETGGGKVAGLERLAKRAAGTPEGDAAARALKKIRDAEKAAKGPGVFSKVGSKIGKAIREIRSRRGAGTVVRAGKLLAA